MNIRGKTPQTFSQNQAVWTIKTTYGIWTIKTITISIFHHISMNLTISHHISQELAISHWVSPYLTKFHQITLNLTQFHNISSNLAETCKISPNISIYMYIKFSILWIVKHHFTQYIIKQWWIWYFPSTCPWFCTDRAGYTPVNAVQQIFQHFRHDLSQYHYKRHVEYISGNQIAIWQWCAYHYNGNMDNL